MDKEIIEPENCEDDYDEDEAEDESGFLERSREFGLFWRSIGGSSIG